MPLTGDPKKDIPELIRANAHKLPGDKRPKDQIIAIALEVQREKRGKHRRK